MPRVKKVKNAELKKCRICTRSTRDENTLGPFRETDTVAAHYKCVLFSPVVPDKLDFDPNGIAGMSARFIRDEGRRAEPLVIFSLSSIRFSVNIIAIIFPDLCVLQETWGECRLLLRRWN